MDFYRTAQFDEIVYLINKGIEYNHLERDEMDTRKVIFAFKESDEREKLSKDFYNHKGNVQDALSFVDEIRHVKALIYNFLNR